MTALVDPLIGTRLGDYVVEQLVGGGGMGLVYRAAHRQTRLPVALKTLRPELADDRELIERLLREGHALNAVKHPGVVEVLGFGHLPDGRGYLLLEYLEGETLEARLRRDGALPIGEAVSLMGSVLEAIGAAHAAGVVHRDLKPGNVFLTRLPTGGAAVKVVDFGLGKLGIPAPGDRASVVAGTPQYISPEQIRGLGATPRADLYSFGVMLFEVLTGRLPFDRLSWAELVSAHLQRTPPRLSASLPGVSPALESLVSQLLAKEPGERPASAEETLLRLRAAQGPGDPSSAHLTPAAPRSVLPMPKSATWGAWTRAYGLRRGPLLAGLCALIAAGAVAASALALRGAGSKEPEDRQRAAGVESLLPPPVSGELAPATVPQPEPRAAPPVLDPDFERKMALALERERRLGEDRLRSGSKPPPDSTEHQAGWIAREAMTEETHRALCRPGWKENARAHVKVVLANRRAAVDPDAVNARETIALLERDARAINAMIDRANDFSSCKRVTARMSAFDR